MPRKLRIQYPGAMYHVMSRGDRREKIFLDDIDRQDFIKTLAEACQKTGALRKRTRRRPKRCGAAGFLAVRPLSGRCFPEWSAAIMLENCIRKPRGQRPNESSRKNYCV